MSDLSHYYENIKTAGWDKFADAIRSQLPYTCKTKEQQALAGAWEEQIMWGGDLKELLDKHLRKDA